jgi:hypothetical protein
MWRTVSSSIPQRDFASPTTPIQDRYWFRRQCPIRAWIRIDACLEVKVPYRRSVCRPGRAWSNFHAYWPGRSSELERIKSLLRSLSTSRITPAASRISLVAGAVGVKSRLAASQTASSASVSLDVDTGYGYRYAEEIRLPRDQF